MIVYVILYTPLISVLMVTCKSIYVHIQYILLVHVPRDVIPLAAAYEFSFSVTLENAVDDSLAAFLSVAIPPGILFASSVSFFDNIEVHFTFLTRSP